MIRRFTEKTEEQLRILQAYWEVFGSEAGQIVIEDMERQYDFDHDPYTKGDPYDTHRKIGNHEVIKDIKRALESRNWEIKVIKEEREED